MNIWSPPLQTGLYQLSYQGSLFYGWHILEVHYRIFLVKFILFSINILSVFILCKYINT